MKIEARLAAAREAVHAEDLERAQQALIGIIADRPRDVRLRAELARVCRSAGTPDEAGRWGYLTTEHRPSEFAEFARHHRGLEDDMLLALVWRGKDRDLSGEARARLQALRRQAKEDRRVRGLPVEASVTRIWTHDGVAWFALVVVLTILGLGVWHLARILFLGLDPRT